MALVDLCVWIDYFQDRMTPATDALDVLLINNTALVGDLIATEVLQGFKSQKTFDDVVGFFDVIGIYPIMDPHIAVLAAQNYRFLRARGITPHGTLDTLIATRCIRDGITLLTSDRDFEPFAVHLGLRLV